MDLVNYAQIIAHDIEMVCKTLGLYLKLALCRIIDGGERYIFTVYFTGKTRMEHLKALACDIQLAAKLPVFHPYIDGLCVRIVVSTRPHLNNDLAVMLKSDTFQQSKMNLPVALGWDMQNAMFFEDLASMLHCLIGGATSSGKTIGARNIIASIAFRQSVSRANQIIIDTEVGKLHLFDELPHLSHPIVKDYTTAVYVMESLLEEVRRRNQLSVAEIQALPALICVVDEYNSLIGNMENHQRERFTKALSNILRLGRQAKTVVILLTQEATKQEMQINQSNLVTRIAYKCSDQYSSRAILGACDAEKLSGKGAMYFKSPNQPIPMLLQGAFMSDQSMEHLVHHIVSRRHDFTNKFVIPIAETTCFFVQAAIPPTQMHCIMEVALPSPVERSEMADIILWVLRREKVSASQLMQTFRMSNRAYTLIERLQEAGIVSKKYANQPRQVLLRSVDDLSSEISEFMTSTGLDTSEISAAFTERQKNSHDDDSSIS